MPAQYGYRTAGVVDIRTRGSNIENGGNVSVLGGSRGHGEASLDLGGTSGAWSGFLTSSFLRNDIGIESPTAERNAIHDTTRQQKAFGSISNVIDANSRISFLFGTSNNRFQIPNVPGQTPDFAIDGNPPIDSARLDARQNEKNAFQILTYQASPTDRVDYQVSLFHRYTDVAYQPDPIGDLVFNGVAAQVLRRNEAFGLQGDFGLHLDRHAHAAGRRVRAARALHDDADVDRVPGRRRRQPDQHHAVRDPRRHAPFAGLTYGLYLQDEWRPTSALTINTGARFDHVATVSNEKQWSPRIGLSYDLSKSTRLHVGYARYFTPPPTEKIDTTSVAKFIGTTNALPSDADTSVKSERSHYFDVGISHQLTPTITVGVDGFYRKVRNLQDEGQFGNALIYSAFNYDEGRIRGIEFSMSYRQDGLSMYANAAVSRAEGRHIVTGQFNFDPDELAYIANRWVHLDHDQQLTGSAGVSYQFGPTRVAADLLYGSGLRRGFANTEHLPSYTQVNLSATRSLEVGGYGKLDLRVAVVNAFDRVYELRDGTGIGVGAPQFGPRRGFYLGASKYF